MSLGRTLASTTRRSSRGTRSRTGPPGGTTDPAAKYRSVEHRAGLGSHEIAPALADLGRRQLFPDLRQPHLNLAQFGRHLALPLGPQGQDLHLGLGDRLTGLGHPVGELSLLAVQLGSGALEREQARLAFQPLVEQLLHTFHLLRDQDQLTAARVQLGLEGPDLGPVLGDALTRHLDASLQGRPVALEDALLARQDLVHLRLSAQTLQILREHQRSFLPSRSASNLASWAV